MTKEIIKLARELVAQGWTQKAWARDAAGNGVSTFNDKAVSFCAIGAICAASERLYPESPPMMYQEARIALHNAVYDITKDGGHYSVMEYNDAKGRTREEMVALFDYALTKIPDSV
jgi:hypothetical protein